MKVVVYGKGFLGQKINERLGFPLNGSRVLSAADLEAGLEGERPDIIINCIGATGRPNVDWCESHKPETYFANVHIPHLLAEHCKKHGIKLVHISSGCVYQGDNNGKGWSEDDPPNFEGSWYSWSKAVSERLLSGYDDVLTLRIRMPIDSVPGERELVGKLLRYNKVIVAPNSVTIIDDFITALEHLLRENATGIYNVTNPEPVTHQEILELYEELKGKKLHKEYIDPAKLEVAAPRSNCILNTTKLGGVMRPTKEALRDTIAKYVALGG
jgi:dTDP-4-dehydrorhamnose reductase